MFAIGRSGFGKAAAGASDCAMNSCAAPEIVNAAAKTAPIVIRRDHNGVDRAWVDPGGREVLGQAAQGRGEHVRCSGVHENQFFTCVDEPFVDDVGDKTMFWMGMVPL
jgi:hypothetical protein